MIIVAPLFSKSSVFKLFSVHTKTKSRCCQILASVWRAFSTDGRWRISVDGRPNRRTKAAFSNFSGVLWGRCPGIWAWALTVNYPGYQRFFLRGFRCRSCVAHHRKREQRLGQQPIRTLLKMQSQTLYLWMIKIDGTKFAVYRFCVGEEVDGISQLSLWTQSGVYLIPFRELL